MMWFVGLWPEIAHYGWSVAIIAACIAAAIYVPSPKLRLLAIVVAVATLATIVAYTIGVRDENARMQKQIEAGLERESALGESLRHSAERGVRAEPSDSVRHDPRNRDLWKNGTGP